MVAATHILGISAFYHDSAAALLRDGEIVAAAQEERFSRRKNDAGFPRLAIKACLDLGGIEQSDLAAVVFYDKPIVKFARILETYLTVVPLGGRSFLHYMPLWLADKLEMRGTLRRELPKLRPDCELLFTEHHQAHAASAFYPSPFNDAAVLTVDGVGEWATTVIARGSGSSLQPLEELHFPHSLGLLYSAFTGYCGFRINDGEYKLMGLSAYGEPKYADAIRRELLEIKEDGSFRLNLDYFDFLHGTTMTNERFHRLLGGPPRHPADSLTDRHCDIAKSIQSVTEDIMLGLAKRARAVTGMDRLCLAGGVALNGVSNGKILRERIFDRIWIQPAAGDAGGALGAALVAWHQYLGPMHSATPQRRQSTADAMQGALLGPAFDDEAIEAMLQRHGAVAQRLTREQLLEVTVRLLTQEKVVGWFQGRMEYGPRALGNRSILADPRSPRMQSKVNLKVKFRESFRPLAPAVLRERVGDYFSLAEDSPYMLLVAPLRSDKQSRPPFAAHGLDRIHFPHSVLPAVTHVDYSARVQTVTEKDNPLFYALLSRFDAATDCPVLVNTSFNVRGEPIVATPEDAYACFRHTEIDALILGPYLLERTLQPPERLPPRPKILEETSEGMETRLCLPQQPQEWRRIAWQGAGVMTLMGFVGFWRDWLGGVAFGALFCFGMLGVAVAWVAPHRFRPVGKVLLMGSYLLGNFIGKVFLGIIFGLIVVPLGVVMRWAGHDPLALKKKAASTTFWHPARPPSSLRTLY